MCDRNSGEGKYFSKVADNYENEGEAARIPKASWEFLRCAATGLYCKERSHSVKFGVVSNIVDAVEAWC
jgi:hypothetical protein